MRPRFHISRGCVPFTVACLMLGNLCSGQVLEYSTVIHMEPDRVTEEVSYFIQINGRHQDDLADVTIDYNAEDELDILEAVILDPNGKTIRSVGKKEITTRHDISRGTFFANSMVREFTLKWNSYPYWIRYRYQIATRKFMYACNWVPLSSFGIPKSSLLRVDYPGTSRVRILSTMGMKGDSALSKGRIIRTWKYSESVALKSEVMSAPLIDRLPRVIVAPGNFVYGIPGTLDSWSGFGAWQAQLNTGVADLPRIEVMRVQHEKEKLQDKLELIRSLYHYLQDNTRYISISLGEGGYKSYPASYVTANKYGDCKALTTYMQAQLEAAGIPSYGALVFGDANPPEFFRQVPGPQFNHVVLCVPLGKDTVWLENTANYLPTGYLGTFTQNRDVLVVNGTGSRLSRTPALTARQVLCRRSYDFEIDEEGAARVAANWELRGDDFEMIRALHRNQTEEEFKGAIEQKLPGVGYHLRAASLESLDRDSPVITVKLSLEIENIYRVLGRTKVLKAPTIRLPEFESTAARTTGVVLPYPICEEHLLRFTLPAGETGQISLPKNIDLRSDFGEYHAKFQKEGQVLQVEHSLLLHSGTIPLGRYPAFYQFIRSILESGQRNPITITSKS